MLLVFSAGFLGAQSAPPPAFEVASIKPSAPPEVTQGPNGARVVMRRGAQSDPGRATFFGSSLKDLVARAYSLKPYQVGGPSWTDSERYDISAKIPDGVAQDQVPAMLQALLADRFKMKLHRETKDLPVYALIEGKGGNKLIKSEDSPDGSGPQITGKDGAKVAVPAGGAMRFDMSGKMQMNGVTMANFADMMTRLLDRPVLNMTNIEGKYDVLLEVSMQDLVGMKKMMAGIHTGDGGGASGPAPEDSPSGSIFSAVQKLGLKLDGRKSPIDMMVIDSAEKTPTEN
jgi:uncharacterized protein (TIGR03435 family)